MFCFGFVYLPTLFAEDHKSDREALHESRNLVCWSEHDPFLAQTAMQNLAETRQGRPEHPPSALRGLKHADNQPQNMKSKDALPWTHLAVLPSRRRPRFTELRVIKPDLLRLLKSDLIPGHHGVCGRVGEEEVPASVYVALL